TSSISSPSRTSSRRSPASSSPRRSRTRCWSRRTSSSSWTCRRKTCAAASRRARSTSHTRRRRPSTTSSARAISSRCASWRCATRQSGWTPRCSATGAGTRNVSKIVIGKPTRGFWRRVFFGSIVDALVRGSGEIDIYVISGDGTPPPTPRRRVRPRASEPVPYAAALATALASTALAWLMFPRFELSNIIMVYLLGVVVVSMRFGRVASALASVLSVAAFDFFFVPPYFTFAVTDSQYLVTFMVMLVVALVISDLTLRARDQAEAARTQERRSAALFSLARELAAAPDIPTLLEAALRHLLEIFGGRIVILLPDATGRLEQRAGQLG